LDVESYENDTTPMLSQINAGSGNECSIKNLAEMIAGVTGFQGNIIWDSTKPDGAPRKLMDSSRLLKIGWQPKFSLEVGLEKTFTAYKHNLELLRR